MVKFAVEVFVSLSSSIASKNASKTVDHDQDHADRLSLLYLAKLGHRLKFAKYESEVAATALVGHHQLSEQVNLFVTGWAVFELLLLMAASLATAEN